LKPSWKALSGLLQDCFVRPSEWPACQHSDDLSIARFSHGNKKKSLGDKSGEYVE
jgi:hypothetical protein